MSLHQQFDDEHGPHAYARRRDPVLGEWCITCGGFAWDPRHATPEDGQAIARELGIEATDHG